jgi:hypothetical protein
MPFFNKFYALAIDEIMEYMDGLKDVEYVIDGEYVKFDIDIIPNIDLDDFKDKLTESVFNSIQKFETHQDVLDLLNGNEIFELMGYYNEIKDDFGVNTTVLLDICNIVYYHIGREQIHDEYEWEKIVENCRENKPDLTPETIDIDSSK